MKEFNVDDFYIDPDELPFAEINTRGLVGIRLKFALAGGIATVLMHGCSDASEAVVITDEDGNMSCGLVRYDVDGDHVTVRYATPHEVVEGNCNIVQVDLNQDDLIGLKDFGILDAAPNIRDLPIERAINIACGMAALTIEETVKASRVTH